MAKKKNSTYKQRLLFRDMDLANPVHDDIMHWLDDSVPQRLASWLGLKSTFSDERAEMLHTALQQAKTAGIGALRARIDAAAAAKSRPAANTSVLLKALSDSRHVGDQSAREALLPEKLRLIETLDVSSPTALPPLSVAVPVWEYPITETRHYDKSVAGYADLMVSYSVPELKLDLRDLTGHFFEEWCHSGKLADFTPPDYFSWRTHAAFFEVKTEIPSLGELIRQLQYYRQFTTGHWFVVSPDTRHRETLLRQGFHFIEYQPAT